MRGRGGARGRGGRGARRGAGRGRGGSRGRGRGGYSGASRSTERDTDKDVIDTKELDIDKEVTSFFVGNVSMDQHYEAQEKNRDRYAAGMAVLEKNGVDIAQNARLRALAAAWARHDHKLADAFLQNKDNFGLVEVLKALTLLDSGRRVRVLEKKMKRLQCSAVKVRPKTLGKLKSDIDNLNTMKPVHGSASGPVCKHVRLWVKNIPKEELEFYALHFPTDSWKKLADICHFHPKMDFPSMDWFLSFCYGQPAPEGSMVSRCRNVSGDNVNDLLKEFPIPYAHVKVHKDKLTNESKARIAASESKLDTVIWWYEDLRCEESDRVILQRVKDGDTVNLPNGKLLERLLHLKMYREGIEHRSTDRSSYFYGSQSTQAVTVDENKAPFYKYLLPLGQKKINSISLSLESPIVVMGDASGSMEIAIHTSSIIAGLLTALTSAKLAFFNTKNRYAPYRPKTIEQVLQLAVDTKAGGGTTPAASLWPFYEKKKVVKTIIMVTDEEENGREHNMWFDELYKKYHDEVFPAKLVFVSFLSSQHEQGRMVTKLETAGFHPLVFKLDGRRPDLTKLDKLFGLLNSGTVSFDAEVAEMEHSIKMDGLEQTYKALKL